MRSDVEAFSGQGDFTALIDEHVVFIDGIFDAVERQFRTQILSEQLDNLFFEAKYNRPKNIEIIDLDAANALIKQFGSFVRSLTNLSENSFFKTEFSNKRFEFISKDQINNPLFRSHAAADITIALALELARQVAGTSLQASQFIRDEFLKYKQQVKKRAFISNRGMVLIHSTGAPIVHVERLSTALQIAGFSVSKRLYQYKSGTLLGFAGNSILEPDAVVFIVGNDYDKLKIGAANIRAALASKKLIVVNGTGAQLTNELHSPVIDLSVGAPEPICEHQVAEISRYLSSIFEMGSVDQIGPKTLSDALIASAPVTAVVASSRISAIDGPPGARMPDLDKPDYDDRVHAQRRLANHLNDTLSHKNCNLHPKVRKTVQRYSDAIHADHIVWYAIDDIIQSVKQCRNENLDEIWPDTSRTDLDQLIKRHDQLRRYLKPMPTRLVPQSPRLDVQDVTDLAAQQVVDLTAEVFLAPKAFEVFDSRAIDAATFYSDKIKNEIDEVYLSNAAKKQGRKTIGAGLKAIGAFVGSILKIVKESDQIISIAPSILKHLKQIFDIVVSLLKP